MYKIVITGAESTGKTTLTKKLAKNFNGIFVPEHSRDYVLALKRKYTKGDVLNIAQFQIEKYKELKDSNVPIFFDTWLIITKIWLKVLYNVELKWINDAVKNARIDLYILCENDIPWVPDPVRENGGVMRDRLFQFYLKELEENNLPYEIVRGEGSVRINNAIFAVNKISNTKVG